MSLGSFSRYHFRENFLQNIFLIKDNRKIFVPGIHKKAKTVTKMKETSEMDRFFSLNIFPKIFNKEYVRGITDKLGKANLKRGYRHGLPSVSDRILFTSSSSTSKDQPGERLVIK